MVERWSPKPNVVGSNPTEPVKKENKLSKSTVLKNAKKQAENKKRQENFIHETKLELKRVTWPNKEIVTKASLLIIFIVISSTMYIMLADFFFTKIFDYIRK